MAKSGKPSRTPNNQSIAVEPIPAFSGVPVGIATKENGHAKRRSKEQIKDQLVQSDPTRDYQSSRFSYYGELYVQNLPLWRLWTARMMLTSDPIVNFSMEIRNAALAAGKVKVKSPDPNLAKWIQEQWDFLWNHFRMQLTSGKEFGFAPLQMMFKYDKQRNLVIKGVRDFAPEDGRALEKGHNLVGMRIKGDPLFAPRSLWLTFQGKYGNRYGVAVTRKQYPAWYEKWMDHGAKKLQQQRMIKDAYIGDIFWYPPNVVATLPDGTKISWRDLMREVGENRLSGGALTLPRLLDNQGKELTGYTPPQSIPGATEIFQWVDSCDDNILKAAGVPVEVVQAADSGSGFSGRSIPFLVLLNGCTSEFVEIVQQVDTQVLRPMVWLNKGRDAEYTIEPISLVESFAGDIQGSSLAGGSIGGPQQEQQQQQAQQAPPQQSQHSESKYKARHNILTQYGWVTPYNHEAAGVKRYTHKDYEGHSIESASKEKWVHRTPKHDGKKYIRAGEGIGHEALNTHLAKFHNTQHTEDPDDDDLIIDTDMDDGDDVEQFDEPSYLTRLRELLGKGREAAIKRVAALAGRIRDLPLWESLANLSAIIGQEIRALQPSLTADLTTDTLLGSVGGAKDVFSRLPPGTWPLAPSGPSEAPMHPGEGLPNLPKPPSPILDDLAEVLFPSGVAEPEVHLPALEAAIQTIQSSPAMTGSNYKETAKLVHQGAFAITGDLTEKAVEDVKQQLSTAIQEGKPQKEFIETVAKRLEDGGSPLSPAHIENVFRTNTLAAYSNAQYKALSNPMVVDQFPYALFMATRGGAPNGGDGRTRDEHIALNKLGLDGTAIYRMDDPTFIKFRPPFSWNCFLPDTLLTLDAVAGYRQEYSGKAIRIKTRSGAVLSVTVNHPIATANGFVPAGTIKKGSYVLSNGKGAKFLSSIPLVAPVPITHRSHYEYNKPSFASEVFESIKLVSGLESANLCVTANDFHGDSAHGNGNINAVAINRELLLHIKANLSHRGSNFIFKGSNLGLIPVTSNSRGSQGFRIPNSSPISFPSRGNCLDSSKSSSLRDFIPSDKRSLRHASRDDSIFNHGVNNFPTSDFEFSSNLVSSQAGIKESFKFNRVNKSLGSFLSLMDSRQLEQLGNVSSANVKFLGNAVESAAALSQQLGTLDEIVDVTVFHYNGPVYDFSTPTGLIIAGGVYVSNCRCAWSPTTVEQAARKGVKEAVEWLERAKGMAKATGGTFYQYINQVAPAQPSHVTPPSFEPPAEFKREQVQLSEELVHENKAQLQELIIDGKESTVTYKQVPIARQPWADPKEAIRQVQPTVTYSEYKPLPQAVSFGELAEGFISGLGASISGLGNSIGAKMGETMMEGMQQLVRDEVRDGLQQLHVNINAPIQLAEQQPPTVVVNVPEQAAPVVHNTINLPEQPAPVVNNTINVPEPKPSKMVVERDSEGKIKNITKVQQ